MNRGLFKFILAALSFLAAAVIAAAQGPGFIRSWFIVTLNAAILTSALLLVVSVMTRASKKTSAFIGGLFLVLLTLPLILAFLQLTYVPSLPRIATRDLSVCIVAFVFLAPICIVFIARGFIAEPTIPTLCAACGYDLRAHRPGQTCPECGTLIPPRPLPQNRDAYDQAR